MSYGLAQCRIEVRIKPIGEFLIRNELSETGLRANISKRYKRMGGLKKAKLDLLYRLPIIQKPGETCDKNNVFGRRPASPS